MGAHIDGFIAVVAHTFVIGASVEKPVTGRKADAVLAANDCAEIALRLVKPGAQVSIYQQHVGQLTTIPHCPRPRCSCIFWAL